MSRKRSSMRGRGSEILGRGVDALFSDPVPAEEPQHRSTAAAATPPPPAATTGPDDELEAMLDIEASNATGGEEEVIAAAAPSPVRRPTVASASPAPPQQPPPSPVADGVGLGADALFDDIDIPLGGETPFDDASPMADPFSSVAEEDLLNAIDIPPISDVARPVTPTPPLQPTQPSPVQRPQPPTTVPVRTEPTRPDPSFTPPPTPAPQPPPTTTDPVRPAVPDFMATETTEQQPPTPRPRVRIAGQLPEVIINSGEIDEVRPQSPFIRPEPTPTPVPVRRERTEEEEAELLAGIERERITELHQHIDALYRDVPLNISNRPADTQKILGALRHARTILLENPEDFVDAEFKVQQAQSDYNRIENSEMWGDKYGWRVFWFEVIIFFFFLFSFLGLLAFGDEFSVVLARMLGTTPDDSVLTAIGFWGTFVWGGIGGVVGAMYILWTHVSERQDFERQHTMWYIGQPIMGLILGGVTFLIINAGLLSLQGGEEAAQKMQTSVQFFPALIAFVAGFRPQFVFGLLVKIINVINPTSDTTES